MNKRINDILVVGSFAFLPSFYAVSKASFHALALLGIITLFLACLKKDKALLTDQILPCLLLLFVLVNYFSDTRGNFFEITKSTKSIVYPRFFNAVPKFIVVVVFPVPPL